MKKLISLVLAVCMILSFTACASPAAQETPQNAPAAPAAPEATKAPEAPAKEIVINFPCIWVGTDSKAEYFGKMVADFNAANAGKIKVVIEEQTDYQAYRDKIRTAITAGQAPDVFSFDNLSDLSLYSGSGKLMDLTPYLTEDWAKNFTEGALDAAQHEGKNFAIPYEKAAIPVFYNSKLLEQVGYTEFPKTYDELWVLCEKLKAEGIIALPQMTGENAWTSMLWYSQILLAIGGPDVYSRGLDDPAFVAAANVLKKMYDYTSSDAVGAGASVVNGHFLNGRAAIYMNGPWFINRFYTEGIEGLGDSVKVAPAPEYVGGKGTYGGFVGVVQAYLACGTQTDPAKAAAVVEFLKYITQPKEVAALSSSAGAMFFIKTEATADAERIRTELTALSDAAPYTVPHFQGSMPTAVANEFPQALSSLVLGEVDAQGFVDMLKRAAEK